MSRLGTILLFSGLVLLVAGLIAFRALSGNLMPFVWVLFGMAGAAIIGAVFKDITFFLQLAGQRTTKHGLNLGALVVIVTVIVTLVNYIGYKNQKKFDFTKEGLHSLSDQTKSVLTNLTGDLEVKAYFVDNQNEGAAEKNK